MDFQDVSNYPMWVLWTCISIFFLKPFLPLFLPQHIFFFLIFFLQHLIILALQSYNLSLLLMFVGLFPVLLSWSIFFFHLFHFPPTISMHIHLDLFPHLFILINSVYLNVFSSLYFSSLFGFSNISCSHRYFFMSFQPLCSCCSSSSLSSSFSLYLTEFC